MRDHVVSEVRYPGFVGWYPKMKLNIVRQLARELRNAVLGNIQSWGTWHSRRQEYQRKRYYLKDATEKHS